MPTSTQSATKKKSERKRVGDILRKHRDKKGYTLRQLMDMSGIAHSTLNGIEIGRGDMTIQQFEKLAPALGDRFVRDVSRPARRR